MPENGRHARYPDYTATGRIFGATATRHRLRGIRAAGAGSDVLGKPRRGVLLRQMLSGGAGYSNLHQAARARTTGRASEIGPRHAAHLRISGQGLQHPDAGRAERPRAHVAGNDSALSETHNKESQGEILEANAERTRSPHHYRRSRSPCLPI